jgi:hypothetical protein
VITVNVSINGVSGDYASLVRLKDITAATSVDLPYVSALYLTQSAFSDFVPGNANIVEVTVDGQTYTAAMSLPGNVNVGSYTAGAGVTISSGFYGNNDVIGLNDDTVPVMGLISSYEHDSVVFAEPYVIADSFFTAGNNYTLYYYSANRLMGPAGAFTGTSQDSYFSAMDQTVTYFTAVP